MSYRNGRRKALGSKFSLTATLLQSRTALRTKVQDLARSLCRYGCNYQYPRDLQPKRLATKLQVLSLPPYQLGLLRRGFFAVNSPEFCSVN